MIDREKRLAYAEILRHFASGLCTNREYERQLDDILYHCEDQAVIQIYRIVWYTYCDIRTHKMRGKDSLTAKGRALIARCIMFLHSDEEYLYPLPRSITWDGVLNLLTLGIWRAIWDLKRTESNESKGDLDVWPFFRKEDFEKAQRSPKLLAGIS